MNILIICSFFAPDSSIAAVRPFCLAKYLSKQGHKVTVLRSGNLNRMPDDSMSVEGDSFRVLSALGENCPAVRYEKYHEVPAMRSSHLKQIIPGRLYGVLKKAILTMGGPLLSFQQIRHAKTLFERQKRVIDSLAEEKFDIVFSTYGELENVWAGEYAASVLGAKWIQDYRDLIVQWGSTGFVWNLATARIQKRAICLPDAVTCISSGLADTIIRIRGKKEQVYVLYNGYDGNGEQIIRQPKERKLRICYTGQLYAQREKALSVLLSSINKALADTTVSKSDFCFCYAGPHSFRVQNLMNQFQLSECLEDHGYVSRDEAEELQNSSDIFLVLSWNTKREQGILTGKFYEGIRAKKPILALVVGDAPDSELKRINENYHYGFCYEEAGGVDSFSALSSYLAGAAEMKLNGNQIPFFPRQELFSDFHYGTIAKRLAGIAEELILDRSC